MNLTHSNHLEELADMKGIIKELETELNSMRDQRDRLQEENNHLIQKSHSDDYRNENMRKRVEDLGKTLTLYEKENKAMRELLRLWV